MKTLLVAEWIQRFPLLKQAAILSKAKPGDLFSDKFTVYTSDAFVKREQNSISWDQQLSAGLPGSITVDVTYTVYKAPRLIQPCSGILQVVTSPTAVAMSKVLMDAWNPATHEHLVYAGGLNAVELGAWVEKSLAKFGADGPCVGFTVDASKFDSTVSGPAFAAQFRAMCRIGVDESIIKVFKEAQEGYRLTVRADRWSGTDFQPKPHAAFTAIHSYGVRSGMPTTSVGNSYLMGLVVWTAAQRAGAQLHLSPKEILNSSVMGDDMIVFCRAQHASIVGRHLVECYLEAGFIPEATFHLNALHADFLSKVFTPVRICAVADGGIGNVQIAESDGVALCPKLGRILSRFGWSTKVRSAEESFLQSYATIIGMENDIGRFPYVRVLFKHVKRLVENPMSAIDESIVGELADVDEMIAKLEARQQVKSSPQRSRLISTLEQQRASLDAMPFEPGMAAASFKGRTREPTPRSRNPPTELVKQVIEEIGKVRVPRSSFVEPNQATITWMYERYGLTPDTWRQEEKRLKQYLRGKGLYTVFSTPGITKIIDIDLGGSRGVPLPAEKAGVPALETEKLIRYLVDFGPALFPARTFPLASFGKGVRTLLATVIGLSWHTTAGLAVGVLLNPAIRQLVSCMAPHSPVGAAFHHGTTSVRRQLLRAIKHVLVCLMVMLGMTVHSALEEFFKRCVSAVLRTVFLLPPLPARVLAAALFAHAEAAETPASQMGVLGRILVHVLFTVSPMPLGIIFHTVYNLATLRAMFSAPWLESCVGRAQSHHPTVFLNALAYYIRSPSAPALGPLAPTDVDSRGV